MNQSNYQKNEKQMIIVDIIFFYLQYVYLTLWVN